MDLEILREYAKWSGKKDLVFFADIFAAGWKASEASRGFDEGMVLVNLQDFVEVAQKLPNVIGKPVYYAQWPTPPEDKIAEALK